MNKPNFQFVKPYSKGQITIPLEFRQFLGIDEDTWLHLSIQGRKIVIDPVDKKTIDSGRYPIREERLPSVDGSEYRNIVSDVKGSYGKKIDKENEKVRKEIEKKLEKLDL